MRLGVGPCLLKTPSPMPIEDKNEAGESD